MAGPLGRATASYCASRGIVRKFSISQPARFRLAATPIFSAFSPFRQVQRGDEGKDAPEGVVGRYSVGEFKERLEPVVFGAAEDFDTTPAVGAGDGGADCDRDDVSELGAFRRAPYAGRRRWRSG